MGSRDGRQGQVIWALIVAVGMAAAAILQRQASGRTMGVSPAAALSDTNRPVERALASQPEHAR